MKSYLALSWKELTAQKITSVLILIAIVLSTMMTTVIGQSLGILRALREQQAGVLNGNRYATFHNLTEEQKKILEEDSRLSFVGSNIVLGTADLGNSGISLQLREYDEKGLSIYPTVSQLIKGRLPEKAGEIALPEDALKYLGFPGEIGDKITLSLSISLLEGTEEAYEYQAEFTLCGILESNYLAYVSGIVTGIAGQGTSEEYLPQKYQLYSTDFRTANKRDFQQTVGDLAGKTQLPDSRIQYNWLYLNALGIKYDKEDSGSDESSGFSYMTAAGKAAFFINGLQHRIYIGIVEHKKAFRVLDSVDVFLQNSYAEAVKRADVPGIAVTGETADALLHLIGRFVCKCDAENVGRHNSDFIDQISKAV